MSPDDITDYVQSVELNKQKLQCVISDYLHKFHSDALLRIATEVEHCIFLVSLTHLLDSFDYLSSWVLMNAAEFITCFERTLRDICTRNPSDIKSEDKEFRVRLIDPPSCPELIYNRVPKCSDVGRFICFNGTVVRTAPIKIVEKRRKYVCSRCKGTFFVEPDHTIHNAFPSVTKCLSAGCVNPTIKLADEGLLARNTKDYQEIKVQEHIERLIVGMIPKSIWIVLENDLVDMCKPGDDVCICGFVKKRWMPIYKNCVCQVEIFMVANSVTIRNETKSDFMLSVDKLCKFQEFWNFHSRDPLCGRNIILNSICPQLHGLYVVKLAVALVLAGGVAAVSKAGTRIRGEPHLLLVGDPGTGKSQVLKYVARVVSRAVLTTGTGSTSAGLTVTATREGSEWLLEAGALVLADGGVCCIDEFSSIKEHDQASIHEAMEQQSISVAKAGMVCRLRTRCSVIASCNPKGTYDPSFSLSINLALGTPILSRFDLIIILVDSKNHSWDRTVSSYVLSEHFPKDNKTDVWSIDEMRHYFAAIKTKNPTFSDKANLIIQRYYQRQREIQTRDASRTSVRLLESIIRLSQAHARLMFREKVEIIDVIVVLSLLESTHHSSMFTEVNALHTDFPVNPREEFLFQAKSILEALSLHDVFENCNEYPFSSSDGTSSDGSPCNVDFKCSNEDKTSTSLSASKDIPEIIIDKNASRTTKKSDASKNHEDPDSSSGNESEDELMSLIDEIKLPETSNEQTDSPKTMSIIDDACASSSVNSSDMSAKIRNRLSRFNCVNSSLADKKSNETDE